MTGRAKNGDGGVYYHTSTKTYVAHIMVAGRKVSRRRKTAAEAWEALRTELRPMAARGQVRDTARQTVAEYAEYWLTHVMKRKLRPHSHWNYTSRLAHVVKRSGETKLDRLSTGAINRIYSSLEDDDRFSPAHIRSIHRTLFSMLKQAQKEGLILVNPCAAAEAPSVPRSKPRHLTRDELERLNAALHEPWNRFADVMGRTGLRVGEALALRWSDISAGYDALSIHGTVTQGKAGRFIGPPKTCGSERTIRIGPKVATLLRRQKAWVNAQQLADRSWHDRALVFPGRHGALGWTQTVDNQLARACVAAGIQRISSHALRHSAATLWLHEVGMPLRYAQERLGHADPSITANLYVHADEGGHEKWGNLVDAL